MTIGVHVTAYRRPTITKLAFTCLRRILDTLEERGIDSVVVVGVSEPKSAAIARSFGFIPFEVPNAPLGRKFNETAKELLKHEWTHMLEYCSDNLMEERYTDMLIKQLEANVHYWAMNCFYMMDWKSKTVRVFNNSGWSNVGRVTRRDLVEKLYRKRNYIFEPRLTKRLDKAYNDDMLNMCKTMPSFPNLKTPIILDLKNEVSLNPYQNFSRKPEKYPVVSLEGNFPELKTDKNGDDRQNTQ
tara:strand:- start:1894 stop:2619 length:726 start_codon:yes stop_codon:yes gene_type:complete